MSSSDVSDIEEEKKKMAQEKKPKKNLSDSEEDSEAEKAKAKKKRKMEAKKKEEKKKKKRKEESDSDSDSEAENKKKKKKKNKEEVEDGVELDDEGRVDLGRDKLMDVREFKGRLLIDTREFYTDKKDGEKKPGKKGISLSTAEWENLKKAIPYIDRKIKKMS